MFSTADQYVTIKPPRLMGKPTTRMFPKFSIISRDRHVH